MLARGAGDAFGAPAQRGGPSSNCAGRGMINRSRISVLIMLFDQIEQLRSRRLECAAVSGVARLDLGQPRASRLDQTPERPIARSTSPTSARDLGACTTKKLRYRPPSGALNPRSEKRRRSPLVFRSRAFLSQQSGWCGYTFRRRLLVARVVQMRSFNRLCHSRESGNREPPHARPSLGGARFRGNAPKFLTIPPF